MSKTYLVKTEIYVCYKEGLNNWVTEIFYNCNDACEFMDYLSGCGVNFDVTDYSEYVEY